MFSFDDIPFVLACNETFYLGPKALIAKLRIVQFFLYFTAAMQVHILKIGHYLLPLEACEVSWMLVR